MRAVGRLMAVVFALALVGAGLTAPRPARADAGIPDLNVIDPAVYSYAGAVKESHLVTNRNGSAQSWVDIIRPNTATKVPIIIDASPYFNTLGRGWKHELKNPYDPSIAAVDPTYAAGPRVPFPEWYDEYFVPRGYAVALIDLHGTRNSTGCQVYGGREEIYDTVDDIDWLVGQAWSNGKVGLIGGSYDGTIANGVAAEMPISGQHKDAVAAVVPVRAIDRWYDYQFYNGAPSTGTRLTPEAFTALYPAMDTPNSGPGGDPMYATHLAQRKSCPALAQTTDVQYLGPYQNADNPSFWAPRDFLKNASTWRAATFFIHGQFDYNVKTMNTGQLWSALPASVPKKLWWMNSDHVDPDVPTRADAEHAGYNMPFQFQAKYREGVHRWFLQFLKGVDAGALRTPAVEVQRDDGHFDGYAQYPAPGADDLLHFTPTGKATEAVAAAGTTAWDDSATGAAAPASQVFLSDPAAGDTRLSGQMQFDLVLSALGPDTSVGIVVRDIPPGPAGSAPDAKVYDGKASGPFVFSYGFLQAWYRDTVKPRGPSVPTGGGPLSPGQQYRVSFPSLYMDYILHRGHRLSFTFSDSAGGEIQNSMLGTVVTMYTGPGQSQVRVPIASGHGGSAFPPTVSGGGLPNTSAGANLLPLALLGGLLLAFVRRYRRSFLTGLGSERGSG